MTFSGKLSAAAFGLMLGMGGIAAASAAPADHPRIAEVNHRVAHQEHRITKALHHGKISFAKAERLRMREHAVKAREMRMAVHHHGHLTKVQTRRLNREENHLARKL